MSYAILSLKKKKIFDTVETNEVCDELAVKIPEFKERKQQKYALKMTKILKKYKVNRLVLSSELKNFEDFKNVMLQNNYDVINGKKMYKVLLLSLLNDISKLMKFEKEKMNIALLINEYSADNIEIIKRIADEVKSVTIVTSNAYRFEKIIQELLQNQGIVVQLANQNVNLKRKHIIINLDFSNTELAKVNFQDEVMIITNSISPLQMKQRFNGILIRDIDIYLGKKIENFRSLELCEAYIYQNMKRIKENENRFQHSEYRINGYIGNNGKIEQADFERLGKIFMKDGKQNGGKTKNNRVKK